MSGQSRRTQTQRRLDSERALLQSAVEVISSDGVGAVTFEALAETGGFSRGLASSRFGSKAKLIEALLEKLHERQKELVAQRGLDEMDGLDAILGYVDMGLADMVNRKEARTYGMLLSSSVADSTEMREFFAGTHENVRVRLEQWVRRGQESGSIRPEIDPPSTALMIGCVMFGITMQCLVDPDADYDTLLQSSINLLRASLATMPGGPGVTS